MEFKKIEKNGIICAIVVADEPVITDAQSALDVLMSAKYDVGTKNIVIDKKLDCRGSLSSAEVVLPEKLQKYCQLQRTHRPSTLELYVHHPSR